MVSGMEPEPSDRPPGFWARFTLACRLLFEGEFGRRVIKALAAYELAEAKPDPAALPPERVHASALFLLGSLQREGRLIDFLEQELAGFPDEEVGAAARVVHGGARRVVRQYLAFAPVLKQNEGDTVSVPKGFDSQQIRLTGNVTGEPPFRGQLKHHGWIATEIRMPQLQESLDPRVIAPAEVEL
jgi:hypothetical protein